MRLKILFITVLSLFIVGELTINTAEAGVLIRRAAQSKYKVKKNPSTRVLKSLPQPGGSGKTYGTKKSISAVYKARLKAYKGALKQYKKEQKLIAKLEKAKEKMVKAEIN